MTINTDAKYQRAVSTLRHIADDFLDAENIDAEEADEFGLDRVEMLEMAYDNIKFIAKRTLEDLEETDA